MDEVKTDNSEVIARLTRERDEARAGVERLRELHETAVEQWTLESQNVKTLEEEVERKDDQLMAFSRQWADINTQNAALKNEVERLQKCCTQRGARMQIMRDWMDSNRGLGPPTEWWYFCEERPEAKNWFDDNGVPVDTSREGE